MVLIIVASAVVIFCEGAKLTKSVNQSRKEFTVMAWKSFLFLLGLQITPITSCLLLSKQPPLWPSPTKPNSGQALP